MPQKAKKSITSRRRRIDSAVDKATKTKPKKTPAKKKNPYPTGSSRAKLWARREADKKKK